MKRGLAVLAFVLALVGALATRVVIEGRDALARGDTAIADRRPADAIAAWESAARWYLPGAPHVTAAYERLTALALAEPAAALTAWRAVRSAAIASQGLWSPHAERLATANARITELSARQPEGAVAAGPEVAARADWYRSRLAAPTRPTGGVLVLVGLGLVAAVGGIVWTVRRGVDEAGRFVRHPALVGAAVTVVGIAAWAAGLYNA